MNELYAYIRVSTVRQGEHGSSLQEQRAAIEVYAKRHGFVVTEWFEEKETAARRGRRIFSRMLRQLQCRKAAGVIIHKIDRSARNLRDWADLGELIDQGIQVHFANESLDLNSRGGRLSADIQAVVASDYIRNLREEVKKGFYGRLKQGIYPLPAPIGYKNEGRGIPKSVDPVTAPLVKRAFELYATGRYNFFTLGDELYRLGLRNRNGGRITTNGLSTLLNSQFYLGLIHIYKTGETYQGKHPPLVTKSLFDRVQGILSGKMRNQGLRHDFLYRRRLRCSNCRYSLIAEIQKGHHYYRCHTKSCPKTCLREEDVANLVDETLEKLRLSPRELTVLAADFAKRLEHSADAEKDVIAAIRLNLDQLDARLGRLTDAYIDRLIDKELFEERKSTLFHERAALKERLESLVNGNPWLRSKTENFLELMKRLCTKDNPAKCEENRDIVTSVTSNLGVDAKNLAVAWRPLFAPIAFRNQTTYGEPQRDTPRTFDAEAPSMNIPKSPKPDKEVSWRDQVWIELTAKEPEDEDGEM